MVGKGTKTQVRTNSRQRLLTRPWWSEVTEHFLTSQRTYFSESINTFQSKKKK